MRREDRGKNLVLPFSKGFHRLGIMGRSPRCRYIREDDDDDDDKRTERVYESMMFRTIISPANGFARGNTQLGYTALNPAGFVLYKSASAREGGAGLLLCRRPLAFGPIFCRHGLTIHRRYAARSFP